MRVEHSIVVKRPRDVVWAFLADYRNDPKFIDAVTEVSVEGSGELVEGARLHRRMRLPIVNTTVDAVVKIVTRVEGEVTAFKAEVGPLSFVETREIVAVSDDSTRVLFRLEGDHSRAVKMGEWVVSRQAKKAMEKDLSSLKRVLEAM